MMGTPDEEAAGQELRTRRFLRRLAKADAEGRGVRLDAWEVCMLAAEFGSMIMIMESKEEAEMEAARRQRSARGW